MRIFQIQRITAIALLVFMTIHMTFLHYDVQKEFTDTAFSPYEISFDTVITRLESPLWKAIDIAFLVSVLAHGILGAYMVITDLQVAYKFKHALLILSGVIFVAALIYGTLTVLAFQAPPTTAMLP